MCVYFLRALGSSWMCLSVPAGERGYVSCWQVVGRGETRWAPCWHRTSPEQTQRPPLLMLRSPVLESGIMEPEGHEIQNTEDKDFGVRVVTFHWLVFFFFFFLAFHWFWVILEEVREEFTSVESLTLNISEFTELSHILFLVLVYLSQFQLYFNFLPDYF